MENLLNLNLDQLLKKAVSESLEGIAPKNDEKDLQSKKTKELKPFKAAESDETAVDEDEESVVKKQKPSDKLPEINLSAVVELVGSIRAGRSLKDKGALRDLKEYFRQLNGTERTALFAFLTGISKIMRTPDTEEAPEIKTPDEAPYSVKMDRVVKAKKVEKSSGSKPSGEDSPIVVGEAADKSNHKSKIYSFPGSVLCIPLPHITLGMWHLWTMLSIIRQAASR